MSEWSKNNLAHRRTYISLRILAEAKRKFASAGSQKVKKFDFWDAGDSPAIRRGKARALSVRLNNLFIEAFRSKFEAGFTQVRSVNAMTAILVDGDKIMKDLAEVADVCYDFFGEEP